MTIKLSLIGENTDVKIRTLGQATVELTPFRHIVGFDPSAKMIEQAKKGIAANGTGGALPGQLRYEVSRAESLYSVKDSSVDLVVSGTPLIVDCRNPCMRWLMELFRGCLPR